MKSARILLLGLGLGLLICTGCSLLELQTAPDGTVTTPLTTAIGAAGEVAGSAGMFFPIAGAIGGILSLTANGILGVVARKKSTQASKVGTALEAVAAGVNEWTVGFEELKENILSIVKESGGDVEKAKQAIDKVNNVKGLISMIAENKGIYTFLKTFIKVSEARGVV